MKSPNMSTITVAKPSQKKAKFNLSHDVNTSYDWGSVQPLLGKLMLADSSINLNMEQLTRLAPMVVPTFGRVKMKNVAHFISIKDIFPNWDYFQAKQQISRSAITGVSTFVPNELPHINSSVLTMIALAGSKFNWYVSGADPSNPGANNVNTWRQYTFPLTGYDATARTAGRTLVSHLFDLQNTVTPTPRTLASLGYTGFIAAFRNLTTGTAAQGLALKSSIRDANGEYFVDLPCLTTVSPVEVNNINTMTHSANAEQNPYDSTAPIDVVTMEGADLIWESDTITSALRSDATSIWNGMNTTFFDGCKVRICFRLSSFGKRLRKVLIGLGYNFSLTDSTEVSLLPLLAYYKAYWDSYAPERDRNFYMTPAWKLIEFCSGSNGNCDLTTCLNNNNAIYQDIFPVLKQFLFDLGTCFATDAVNAISAATDSMYMDTQNANTGNSSGVYDIVSEVLTDFNARFVSNSYGNPFSQDPSVIDGSLIPSIMNTFQSDVTPLELTQPMLDAMKIAYRYVNKYSVAGKQMADILRMNGQGDYVEECKGKFIAANEDTIKISDVVATAGTTENPLGDYGGRGIGYAKGQISYKTDVAGFFILLSSIVPESGYVNAPDMTNEAIFFGDFYNPEFDGLNYEALEKKQVVGSPLMSIKDDSTHNDTFGFLPTYSSWKFMSNKANGDFSLHSQAMSLRPYTLDKYIPVNDVSILGVYPDAQNTNLNYTYVSPTFKYSDLPNAGEDYRYINKMAWNGDYNRIFKAENDGIDWVDYSMNNTSYLYNSFEYDNFLTHNVLEVAYYAPMKAIEDSYSTYDPEDKENLGGIRRS